MSKEVRIRRGTTLAHASFTGAEGEVTYDTDLKCLRVHDGVTVGGTLCDPINRRGTISDTQSVNTVLQVNGNNNGTGFFVEAGSELDGGLLQSGPWARELTTLVYAASLELDFAALSLGYLALAGAVTFTTDGLASGYLMEVVIVGDGSSRNLTWPAGWVWVGSAAPAALAANKSALLRLFSTTGLDSGVIATWQVQS